MACAKDCQQWCIAVCGGNGFLWGHSLFWKIHGCVRMFVVKHHPEQGEAPIGCVPVPAGCGLLASLIGQNPPIAGNLESSEQPQPIVGVLASLIGQTNPIAGELESSEQPQPIVGVLASLTGRPQPIAGGPLELDRPTWPENLVEIIQSVMSMKIHKPTKPEFAFDMSMEAAERNYLLLKKYDGSLAVALQAQGDSLLSMGSEFRPLDVLQAIYGRHPIWERMVSLLKNGSTWPLDPIDEGLQQSDLQEALEFGNNKGAKQNPELLLELVSKDVKHGYAVTFPLSKAVSIQGISLAPMNIMHQNSIDESGRIVEKDQLTHDQSFMFGLETSVNSRARTDNMLPCMYGACLRRLTNWACAARAMYPNIAIFASKVDFKSAYRRCHLNPSTALQSCTQVEINEDD